MRGFEIAIKEASPYAIMTSYNFINGIKVPEYGTICREIMRDEFGYCGMLVTDWENNSVHVRELAAGHDLKMASGNAPAVADAIRSGELSRGRVEESACRILEFIAKNGREEYKISMEKNRESERIPCFIFKFEMVFILLFVCS